MVAIVSTPLTGTLTGTGGDGNAFLPKMGSRDTNVGSFNIFLQGAAGSTVQLERSPDNGVTWYQMTAATGTQIYVWTLGSANISDTVQEVEPGVIYRLNCTTFGASVAYRMSGQP